MRSKIMTNLTYQGVEYNVVLIDPSIQRLDGDGLTPETAFKDLPETLANNTCYLFRRTDSESVSVKHQIDKELKNLMFLGMPKATDAKWIQDLITDETINSAWKADEASFANVCFWFRADYTDYSSYNRDCLNCENFEDVTCINCYLYRDNVSTGIDSSYSYVLGGFFGNNGQTQFLTNLRFYNCKFGFLGLDLDKDEFLNQHSAVTELDSSSKYASRWCRQYVHMRTVNRLVIDNCILNHVGLNSAGSDAHNFGSCHYIMKGPGAFVFENVRYLSIQNSTFNSTGLYYDSNENNHNIIYARYVTDGAIKHIKAYHILGSSLVEMLLNMDAPAYGQTEISDIDIWFKKFKDFTYDGRVYNKNVGMFLYYNNAFSFNINNITLHGNEENIKIGQACVLDILGRNYSHGVPFSSKISNIKIDLADDMSQCVYTLFDDKVNNLMFDFRLKMNSEGLFDSGNLPSYRYNTQDTPQIKNISIHAPYTKLYCNGIVANFDELHCRFEADWNTTIDIKKLTNDKTSLPGILVTSRGNYIRVREYVADPLLQTNTLQVSRNFYSNAVYVDKSNVNLFDTVIDSATAEGYRYAQICCPNMIKEGLFFARNGQTFAQSWGVIRTGSSSLASLKLSCNYAENALPLMVGTDPYKGFAVKPESTGKKNLIAYICCKNFDEETLKQGPDKFKLMIRVPYNDEKGTLCYATYFSSEGIWEEDSSQWNAEDYIAKKIVVPIDVKITTQPIEVKIVYNWYHNIGVTYFDPDMKLEEDLLH